MSEAALRRIENAIERLCEQQEGVCERLERLEQRADRGLAPGGGSARPGTEEIIGFLDQYRAAEALGEASVGAWLAVSDTACVRGALRTIQVREGFHARLLEERVKELGGSPKAEIPAAAYEATMKDAGSTEKSDAQKLREFVARFQDIDQSLKPLHDMADRLDHDPETQALVRTIAQDERSTLECLHATCRQLSG